MNEKEATAVLSILKAAYPNSYKDISRRDAHGVISVWTIQLADTPAELVYLAIQKLISVSKFPPTVAEVREKIVSIGHEADGVLWQRRSRLEIATWHTERHPDECEDADTVEYSDFEKQAVRIQKLTEGFKAELSLHQLMQNDVLRGAIENPDVPPNLALLGAKTNE